MISLHDGDPHKDVQLTERKNLSSDDQNICDVATCLMLANVARESRQSFFLGGVTES